MPDAADGQAAQQQRQGFGGGGILGSILRMAFFYYMMKYFNSNKTKSNQPVLHNLFQRGEPVDIYLYIDESPMPNLALLDGNADFEVSGFHLATDEDLTKNITIPLPDSVQKNGTIYLHAYVVREGHDFDPNNAFYSLRPLTKHAPKRKETKEKNLLFDSQSVEQEEEPTEREIVNYWKPKITVAILDNFAKQTLGSVPVHLQPLFMRHPEADYYYPMIFFNEFWLLNKNLIEINETVSDATVEITLSNIAPWKVQIFTQLEESFKLQEKMGMNSDEETDQFKKILVEGNPILLGVTFVVSILHSIFDFLAFKNDIGFWKDNKSMRGLSARSILINAGCQLVIFLYLVDNETSFVVLVSAGIGTLIEFWKVTKAMEVTVKWVRGVPLPHFEDRESYVNSETKKHDAQAMKYLSYALYPLVIGYSIYALFNESHKSWYSWILSSLVGAVYAFGFILMCPQLYLNYKLKSVAHLPWRQLTYKFLNTIIDDLFAFVITMPWLHRLSVFRDDLVFVIYLYQWWLYGVDKTRVNEFGFSEEKPPESEERVEGRQAGPSVEPTEEETKSPRIQESKKDK